MSTIGDLVVQQTDPVTALILFGILVYLRSMKQSIREDIQQTRARIKRVENRAWNQIQNDD